MRTQFAALSRSLSVFAIMFLLGPAVAFALEPCGEALTTKTMVDCFQGQLDESNRELDELDRTLMGILSGGDQKLFREASQAWVNYRLAHCHCATAEFQGGSLEPVGTLVCWLRITKGRIEEVRLMFGQVLKHGVK